MPPDTAQTRPADLDAARRETFARLLWPLRLTRLGLVAERVARCFWPMWAVLCACAAAVFLGLHELVGAEAIWGAGGLATLALLGFGVRGARRFRWPGRDEAIARLDATLPGQPLQTLSDSQAIGAGDSGSAAVWAAHLRRMARRAEGAAAVAPDLRLSSRDPFALRYVALTALAVALLFGSVWRVGTLADQAAGLGGTALASGPAWEGWVEPPAYTGRPSLYLTDITAETLTVPEGSRISVRLYGAVGALTVTQSVSDTPADADSRAPVQSFDVTREGSLSIGDRDWRIVMQADTSPTIAFNGPLEREAAGRMSQRFVARDDYGVVAGRGRIELDTDAVPRRHGMTAAPDPREPIVIDLPMTITGNRADFAETIVEDFSEHPWSGLPVRFTLTAVDAAGQEGQSSPLVLDSLPGRRFFDPLAAALIEQRRDLLWARDNGARVAQIIRAVTNRPGDVVRDSSVYLQIRVALRQLENAVSAPAGLTPEAQDEIAEALWEIALKIEEGDLSDALERLRRAQDRLAEAIKNGATDAEIAQLMQEMRDALQDYINQLARNADPSDQQQMSDNTMEMSQDQLQQLLDRLQQLMEEGRTAEAQQLLDQLRQMMENMQVTQGRGGQGQQGPGQQAMEDLAETLRQQQGLSDEAFNDLQQQFQPGQQGQPGQGQQGQGQQGGNQSGTEPGREQGAPSAESLAQRQRDLRRELDRQSRSLPGAGTEEGDAAREALGRAGQAMERAEGALEDNDLPGAIDEQAQAMEALREGLRSLGEAMARQQQPGQGQGQQGQANGQPDPNARRDPLGRDRGNSGPLGTDEDLLQGDDTYRRARDLLDEIRRRSAEQERPEVERDYLKRLLERF